MARELINLVACEGLQQGWRAPSRRSSWRRACGATGFRPREASLRTRGALERMLDDQPRGFHVRQLSPGCFRLTWQGRPIFAASFWQPTQGRLPALVESGTSACDL